MKTKYVICGGAAHIPDPRNDGFYREILKGIPEKVKILLVLFAKEGEKITENSEEDKTQFNKVKDNRQLEFKIANKENFIEEIAWSDVIFIHGGDPEKQLATFRSFGKEQLRETFKGKVVGADSAGSYFLAEYAYSSFKDQTFKGLGLLPIKLICHYIEGVEKNISGLEDAFEEVLLREYEYRVF